MSRIRLRKGLLTLMALLVILMTTGCVKVKSNLKINKDGSSDLTLIYALDEQIASFGGDVNSSLNELKKGAEEKGFKASNYKDDDYLGVKVTKNFEDFKEVSSDLTDEQQLFKFNVDEKKGFFKNTYAVKSEFDFTGMTEEIDSDSMDAEIASSVINQMDLSFTLVLPVKAGENNASEVKNDGKTLEWVFIPNEINDVEFEFEKVNTLNIVLLVAGLVAVVISLFFILKRRKKNV